MALASVGQCISLTLLLPFVTGGMSAVKVVSRDDRRLDDTVIARLAAEARANAAADAVRRDANLAQADLDIGIRRANGRIAKFKDDARIASSAAAGGSTGSTTSAATKLPTTIVTLENTCRELSTWLASHTSEKAVRRGGLKVG